MPRIITNAVKNTYTFLLHFADGREEEVKVEAESISAAVLGLPKFADVGQYRYELKGGNGK